MLHAIRRRASTVFLLFILLALPALGQQTGRPVPARYSFFSSLWRTVVEFVTGLVPPPGHGSEASSTQGDLGPELGFVTDKGKGCPAGRPLFLSCACARSILAYTAETKIRMEGCMGDIHITQDMLDAVSRGELPPSTLAEIGLKHLLSICPYCRAEIDDWQRRRSGEEGYSTVQALSALLEHQAKGLKSGEQEARQDFRELQRLAFDDRLNRIRRAQRRFRGELLAQIVLDEARQHIPAEPQIVYELAETAKAVLSHTPTSPTASILSVRAFIYAGNALRAQGNPPAADKQFALARNLIAVAGVTDTLTYAEIDWFEGTLRKDQRRFRDAEELLVRSVTLYRLAGDHATAVFPLATLGILFYHRQEYRQALETFRVALSQIHPEIEPRLYCYVHHNLTLTLCDMGDYHAAEEALDAGRDSYAECPDSLTQSRLAWIEGKIVLGFGHLERAIEAFRAVRSVFVAEDNGYDAAMVSLDLGLALLSRAPRPQVPHLRDDIAPRGTKSPCCDIIPGRSRRKDACYHIQREVQEKDSHGHSGRRPPQAHLRGLRTDPRRRDAPRDPRRRALREPVAGQEAPEICSQAGRPP